MQSQKEEESCHLLLVPVSLLKGTCLETAAVEPELDSLYAFYHSQCWCYCQRYFYFKWLHALLNALALVVTTIGMVVGSLVEDSLWPWSALGVALKGWNDLKKFPIKLDMCRFAFTTYAKTLTELRNCVQGLPFDEDTFLVKMQTLDDTITDFAPPLPDACCQKHRVRFKYVAVEGNSVDHSNPRAPPSLNATRLSLLEKQKAYKKT